jgi:tRNA(Ile)-lysidine synthetase-like protein
MGSSERGLGDGVWGMELLERTRSALLELGVSDGAKIVVGVSGGPDSIALAHVLASLEYKVIVAHIDHALRVTSAKDVELVKTFAASHNLPFETIRFDTRSIAAHQQLGIEETARNLRYEFFGDVADKHGVHYVATAHTANDQAETVIMNAVRGAGVRGLAGIPAKRKLGELTLVRPLLGIERPEIERYIEENNLQVIRDESNSDLNFQRNRIRHSVMPVLEAAYPDRSPVKALGSLARRMGELQKFLSTMTAEKLEVALLENGTIKTSALENLHGYPLHALLEAWIAKGAGHYRLTETESKKLKQFIASDARRVELRHGFAIERKRDKEAGDVLSVSIL